jgi:glycine cleavage system H protein
MSGEVPSPAERDEPSDAHALTFMMGQFEARFPTDRLYAKNHMWAQPREGTLLRFGFTAYAVRLLQDVYFLDWSLDAGAAVHEKQQIGSIESKKAESDLYSPLAGVIVEFNQEALRDPALINADKYARGWLFDLDAPSHGLLTAEQYVEHLASVWEVTQRTIKGQMNE